jgi:nitrate reductase assembly molybdenum cofactor insertion protein NarJ
MTLVLTDAATRLLREAAEWRLIALLLERPTSAWRATRAALAAECADRDLAAVAAAAADATEGGYLRTLGPGGVASPREIAHSVTRDPGHVLGELSAFYGAFAYRPPSEEPPDHVSVEAGFVAYLKVKEAFAITAGDDTRARLTSEAAASFVEQHLSTFAQPLADRLALATDGYLCDAAAALARRTGPRRADAEGGWTPEGLDGEQPFDCDGCTGNCEL